MSIAGKKMKKTLKIKMLLLALFLLNNITYSQELTLALSINIALNKNERISQYQEKLKQKEIEDLASWGNFLPIYPWNMATENHFE